MRPINPKFNLTHTYGQMSRDGKRTTLLNQTARAHNALMVAEFLASELGLDGVAEQLARSRDLLEQSHHAAKAALSNPEVRRA